MWGIFALLLVGLLLSAFFSGSETGFYRVARVRLVLDALDGDRIARGLLWLTNNPALFVATALIGNNVANYLVSLAIVLGAAHVFDNPPWWVDLLAPVMLAPVLFVYGELLPKQLFYQAPNMLLRRLGPLFLVFTVLFAPISALLWGLGRLLQSLVGQTPLRVQLTLARKELQEVLQEGQAAGILQPAQRQLAQGLFSVASQPVRNFSKPVARVATVRMGDSRADVLRLARRHGVPVVPVTEAQGRELAGYVRIVDLNLEPRDKVDVVRPLTSFHDYQSFIVALIQMQTRKEELAGVSDADGNIVGLLYLSEMTDLLLREK